MAHFVNGNVICISIETLFNLLKKHFWCHGTKINNFGMKTFFGQKCTKTTNKAKQQQCQQPTTAASDK